MKKVLLGTLIGAGLVMVAVGSAPEGNELFAQHVDAYRTSTPQGELIALSTEVNEKYQQLTVIDPRQKVLSVYHIDLSSGDVTLQCVRNITWDLQMTHYNGASPLPREIQALLQPK